jgi:hypothetical protein
VERISQKKPRWLSAGGLDVCSLNFFMLKMKDGMEGGILFN